MCSSKSWLPILRQEMIQHTIRAAQAIWISPGNTEPFYNYRLEHYRQVERDVRRILNEIEGDEEIVLAAVWTHDRMQPQYDGPSDHGQQAVAWAEMFLKDIGFPPEKIPTVSFVVANHSNPPQSLPENPVEARILWDADKLSKVGAMNVVNYLMGAPAFPNRKMTLEIIAKEGLESLDKKEGLIEKFYFPISRAIAKKRFQAQSAFYQALREEVLN